MMTTNSTPLHVIVFAEADKLDKIYGSLHILLGVFVTVENSIALFLYQRRIRAVISHRIMFPISLALADTLFGVFIVFCNICIVTSHSETWRYCGYTSTEKMLYQIAIFIKDYMSKVSELSTYALVADRFFLLRYPFSYENKFKTSTTTLIVMLAAWMLPFIIETITFTVSQSNMVYSVFVYTALSIIGNATVVALYLKIHMVALNARKETRNLEVSSRSERVIKRRQDHKKLLFSFGIFSVISFLTRLLIYIPLVHTGYVVISCSGVLHPMDCPEMTRHIFIYLYAGYATLDTLKVLTSFTNPWLHTFRQTAIIRSCCYNICIESKAQEGQNTASGLKMSRYETPTTRLTGSNNSLNESIRGSVKSL